MIARNCERGRAAVVFALALLVAAPVAASLDDGDWFDDYSPVYDEAPYSDDYQPFEASGPSFDAEIRSAADEMDSLSPEELERLSHPSDVSAEDIIGTLNHMALPTFVDLVLVGFDGNGNGGVRVDAAVLQRHLDVLRRDHHWVHTMQRPDDAGIAVDNHTLPLRVDYIIKASHSDSQLAVAVNRVVAGREGAFLDPAVLEHMLKEHTDAVHSGSTLTLFLLNPQLPLPDAGDEQVHQAYWYRPRDAPPDTCGSQLGVAAADRFAWIDLSAGPSSYGPATAGSGVVTMDTLPSIRRALSDVLRRQGRKAAERGSALERSPGFLGQLVALAIRSAEVLLPPTLTRLPRRFATRVTVALTVVTFTSTTEAQYRKQWEPVRKALQGFALRDQTVELDVRRLEAPACPVCLAGLAAATRSHPTMEAADGRVTSVDRQFLDGDELRHWALQHDQSVYSPRFDASKVVIPAYVFDLSAAAPPLLFEGRQRALAFDKIVLGVQAPHHELPTDVQCNGAPRTQDASDARTPVLAALLDAVWGVAPMHRRWDPVRGRADEDWLWAGAFHPLSPLATSGNALAAASDSGEQRLRPVPVVVQDAARRFVIAREMLSELSPVVNYVAEVEGHGLPLHALMSAADHTRYVRRWNRVKQHLDRIAAYLALHDYDHALYHVRSLQADAKMLAALSRRASRRISSHLDCLQQDAGVYVLEVGAALLAVLVAVGLGCVLASRFVHRKSPSKTL